MRPNGGSVFLSVRLLARLEIRFYPLLIVYPTWRFGQENVCRWFMNVRKKLFQGHRLPVEDLNLSWFHRPLPITFDGMVSCGITKRKLISLHRLFLRTTNLRKPLKPACTIPCVGRMCFN